ncbi:MAG: glucan biosynthesis protein D [Rhodovulum sulfidophilum]|uniref:Glucan biosynthesis protein D n=1 Tax=Rhodovulum sulfidophilum TaxID=35806 RepID=A0A2W5N5U4_RHOSU|nr:MAG: glucan biosynthesis protein D [Rhodovulum sulfidophilum]
MTLAPVTRRDTLAAALASGAFFLLPRIAAAQNVIPVDTGPAEPFSFDIVRDMARRLSTEPYVAPEVPDAQILESIDYDLHQKIVYRPEATLWGNDPAASKVRFFHPGRYFKEPVRMYVVDGGQAREIPFTTRLFDMPEDHPARLLGAGTGFAGFRVMDEEAKDDWMAFLGASYWRTSGYVGQFGMSVRGLAIDAGAATPEEFPRFTRFWLEKAPSGGLITYALMESPRVTGAYRIVSNRDNGVVQDVDANIFLRGDIDRLGIAPLTSMFWFGKNNHFVSPDWRPEVHDSDGLEILTGAGERIWRPLNNPPYAVTNSFGADGVRGFGLAQRERNFAEYEDDGVFYEKRATVWVEPKGDWGAGAVTLVELSTNDEIHDNIVAFWRPAEAATKGSEFDISYRLNWVEASPRPEVAQFVATRIGAGGVPGQPRPANTVKFVCDLDGRGFQGLDRSSGVEVDVTASRGEIGLTVAYPIAGQDGWRVMFDLDLGPETDDNAPIDLRMFIHLEGKALSETWLYQVFPSQMRELLAAHA